MLFFQSEDTEVFKADRNKLFASKEKQIDNHLTSMLDMLHYHCRDAFHEKYFLVLLLLVKALNFNFYVHKAPPKVEE